MDYFLDTNVLINHLNGNRVAQRYLKDIEQHKLAGYSSVLIEYELLSFPKLTSVHQQDIENLLQIITLLPLDSAICRQAAQFRRQYHHATSLDALIAATAYCYRFTLLTFDKEFQRIKELSVKILKHI